MRLQVASDGGSKVRAEELRWRKGDGQGVFLSSPPYRMWGLDDIPPDSFGPWFLQSSTILLTTPSQTNHCFGRFRSSYSSSIRTTKRRLSSALNLKTATLFGSDGKSRPCFFSYSETAEIAAVALFLTAGLFSMRLTLCQMILPIASIKITTMTTFITIVGSDFLRIFASRSCVFVYRNLYSLYHFLEKRKTRPGGWAGGGGQGPTRTGRIGGSQTGDQNGRHGRISVSFSHGTPFLK